MKKYLLFAAAMLGLVACQNNDPENVAPRKVTLHATVENGDAANGPHRVAPVDPTAATVNFTWEAGDQVAIKTDAGSYTLDATNINGNQADFEGEVAGDLTNYTAHYGYVPSETTQTIEYVAGSFKPCVYGEGHNDNFTLDQFFPVLKLQLIGASTLGKIEYLIGTDVKATMTITDGIALTSTASVVYLPVADVAAAGFSLKFYDNAATPALIMEKSTTFNLADKMGKIVTMPVLEVKAATPDPKDIFVDNNTFELVFTDKTLVYYITYVYADGLFTCQKVLAALRDEPEETEDMTTDYAPYVPATKTTGNALTFSLGGMVYVDINADANPATCLFRSLEPLNHPELWGVQQIKVNDVDITDQFTMSRDIPNENE